MINFENFDHLKSVTSPFVIKCFLFRQLERAVLEGINPDPIVITERFRSNTFKNI